SPTTVRATGGRGPCSGRTIRTTASSSAAGAWSPPIASMAMRFRLLGLLGFLDLDDLAAVVPAALHAHTVRRLGLAAIGAAADAGELDARHPLGAPRVPPGARLSAFLDCHLGAFPNV